MKYDTASFLSTHLKEIQLPFWVAEFFLFGFGDLRRVTNQSVSFAKNRISENAELKYHGKMLTTEEI